jgi:hypothetical protein
MRRFALSGILCFAAVAAWVGVHAQNPSSQPAPANPQFATDYPADKAGIFLRDSTAEWEPLTDQSPTKAKTAHGFADSYAYGTVSTMVVAEYDGEHAATQVDAGEPTICICNMASLLGQPVIVRLHVKKGARELYGGSKIADANKTDLIPVDELQQNSHIWRDAHIWLIRPRSALPPGEYALMLGTENLNILPFTVTEPASASAATKANP